MVRKLIFCILLLSWLMPVTGAFAEEGSPEFLKKTPEEQKEPNLFAIKSNVLPWLLAIPNLSAEATFAGHWSGSVDVMFCPWKVNDKYSVKTVALLPEIRWWPKSNLKGHFLNLHLSVAWYNVRYESNRYQDVDRPLLGVGIGYGYLLEFNKRWGIEFTIGAGYFNTKYNRYYNIPNGALADTRVTNYWGIDRLGVTFIYRICDL